MLIGKTGITLGNLNKALTYFERKMFGIGLDILVGVFTTDETFGVEDRVLGISRQLILGGVTDQTFIIRRKRNVRRRDSL